MIQHLRYKLLALAVTQILSGNLLASPAPSGRVSAEAVVASPLILKPALLLNADAPPLGNKDNAPKAAPADTTTPYSITLPGYTAYAAKEQPDEQRLMLKLDAKLKMKSANLYDETLITDFSLITSDWLTEMPENAYASLASQGSTGLIPAYNAGDGDGKTAALADKALSALGRNSQSKSSNLQAATNLTVADLMRFLDEFSSNEFVSGTTRAPIVVNLGDATTALQSVLFLQADGTDGAAVVPEPATLALLAASALALHLARRRRR